MFPPGTSPTCPPFSVRPFVPRNISLNPCSPWLRQNMVNWWLRCCRRHGLTLGTPQMGLTLLRIKLPGRRGFTFSCSPSVCFGNSVEGKGHNRLTISPKVCLLGGTLVNARACGQKRATPAPPNPAGPVPTPPLTPFGPTKSWKLNDWRGLADLPKLSTDCNPLGLPTTHPRSSRNF